MYPRARSGAVGRIDGQFSQSLFEIQDFRDNAKPPRNRLANRISLCLCDRMIENDFFRALADPTRRAIFEKLAAGSMNASALREGMEISQPAMSQHLAVLRNAKLVREERQGRFVNYEVDPEGLALIAQWLAKYRTYWPTRIEALKVLLKDMDQ